MVTSLYILSLAILATFLILSAVERLATRKNKKAELSVEPEQPTVLAFGKR
ncbi:hypothetical protein NC797_02070 [Aquibacillus sp. 3ASR75-11]|uniref:Uncharacterized protein n=1 Tax=Terrihalobacillus insolitus TaxID=2950438 RepID=A0A9X4AKG9_9BACI|nr:hypothetical protein [Terrihalobacillus insolitus]MDC3412023.1 hypothetical protein [Terrihalobacillus insolitus]MDC3423292.1 hypothetical protein [Terrihalobacillus insolitus]